MDTGFIDALLKNFKRCEGRKEDDKNSIDRLNPMYSKDYRFRDVYLLATAAEEGDEVFEKVITGLNGWIDCFEKTSIKGTVLCGGVSSAGDISSNDKLKEAYNLGSHV